MRLIISGTREELSDEDRVTIAEIVAPYADRATAIGVGDCPSGVDAFASELQPSGVLFVRFVAHWGALGRKAGPERNGRMVAWATETGGVLLAFPGPRSRGTWDCVRQAREAGLSVLIKRVGGAQ